MCGLLTSITVSLIPTLINRGVLSLKKAADGNSESNRAWSMKHFSTIKFAPVMPASSAILVTQLTDNSLGTRTDTSGHNDIPLDDLDEHTRPWH